MKSPTRDRDSRPGVRLRRWGAFILAIFFVGGLLFLGGPVARYLASSRAVFLPVAPGPSYPRRDDGAPSASRVPSPSPRGQAAIEADAKEELLYVEYGRRAICARAALSKLLMGKDMEEVNRSLRSVKPWKDSGSTWPLHPFGDYDFDEIDFIALLYTFRGQPDKLYPETARHIVDTLLIEN